MENLLTINDVAKMLKVSTRTVREYLRTGRLRGVKLDKSWRILEGDLQAFINARRSGGEPEPEPLAPPRPTPQEHKAELVLKIRVLQAQGKSLRAIAKQFTSEGIPTVSGTGKWHPGTIGNYLAEGG